MDNYAILLKKYPKYISKEQLRIICPSVKRRLCFCWKVVLFHPRIAVSKPVNIRLQLKM